MNSKEKELRELKQQNKEILHELALVEDVLKTLLVNNLLSDAEKLVDTKQQLKTTSTEEHDIAEDYRKQAEKLKEEHDIAEDYRKQVEYFENKIRNMIGRKVYIRPECEEFYDENKELTTLSNNLRNNIFHNHWDFEIIDYDFGMLFLKRKTFKFWVSFDMVREKGY